MTSYLKITSVSTTNPIDMFTLGVSTARGDANKIGQFGSGSLMSTLLWLRNYGCSPVFILNGTRVEFESRPEKTSTGGVFHRVYMSVDGVETPLSVALEYGELDWTAPEMALREWICNALDQGAAIEDTLSKVATLDCTPDEVCVFIPMVPDVQKYWQHIDKYFLHYSDRQAQKCIEKPQVSPCRLYRKGVFVRELNVNTLFDYNLSDLPVNECRTGSSDSMLSRIDDVQCGEGGADSYYDTIFEAIIGHVDCYEVTHTSSWLYSSFRDCLKRQADRGVRVRRLKESGIVPDGTTGYPILNAWYSAFTNHCPALCGYPDRFAADNQVQLHDATDDLVALADDCWRFLTTLLPGSATGKARPSVHSFTTLDGQPPYFMGRFDATQNRVLIWRDCISSRQTMLEEMAHAISGCSDHTRSFQEYLFRVITEAYEVIAG